MPTGLNFMNYGDHTSWTIYRRLFETPISQMPFLLGGDRAEGLYNATLRDYMGATLREYIVEYIGNRSGIFGIYDP